MSGKAAVDLSAQLSDLPAVRGHAPWPNHEYVKGWGVFGPPFDSGHVLALRILPENDLGPYRTVWHRDPAGPWSIHVDGPRLDTASPRYYGPACHYTGYAQIGLTWDGPATLRVTMDSPALEWTLTATSTLWVPKLCHLMRLGHIRGSGHRAGRAAARGRSHFLRVNRFARRADSGSAPGVAGGWCGDPRTHQGRAADAGHRRSGSGPGTGGGRCRSSLGDRVRARRLHRGPDGPHCDGAEHGAGRCCELGVPVADQEREICGLIVRVVGSASHPAIPAARGSRQDAGRPQARGRPVRCDGSVPVPVAAGDSIRSCGRDDIGISESYSGRAARGTGQGGIRRRALSDGHRTAGRAGLQLPAAGRPALAARREGVCRSWLALTAARRRRVGTARV